MKLSPRLLRRVHLLLGCFFAPLLIYYMLSGLWQSYGLDDRKKAQAEGGISAVFVSASAPHKHLTFPGASSKTSWSEPYRWFVAAMVAGLAVTLVLGIYIAFTTFRPWWGVALAIGLGIAFPILLLWSSVRTAAP